LKFINDCLFAQRIHSARYWYKQAAIANNHRHIPAKQVGQDKIVMEPAPGF